MKIIWTFVIFLSIFIFLLIIAYGTNGSGKHEDNSWSGGGNGGGDGGSNGGKKIKNKKTILVLF